MWRLARFLSQSSTAAIAVLMLLITAGVAGVTYVLFDIVSWIIAPRH